jgi:hypothetical protein
MSHSACSASSTPSARASARAASSSAALPLVHDAYAILTADAAAKSFPPITRVSAALPANSRCTRAARVPDR